MARERRTKIKDEQKQSINKKKLNIFIPTTERARVSSGSSSYSGIFIYKNKGEEGRKEKKVG